MVSCSINHEKFFGLHELAKLLPFSYSTLQRWSNKGHKGIKLEALHFPGKVCTSLEAVQRFSERIEALKNGESIPVPADTRDVDRQLKEQFGL